MGQPLMPAGTTQIILTGDNAAASRYIEARLSKFALDVVFSPKVTTWASSYDGRNKEPVTLPEPTKAALKAWLQVRGTEDGPLFVNFDRAGKGERLTGSAVYFIVRELGTKAGLSVRPHGLRHLAITSALDNIDSIATGSDVTTLPKTETYAMLLAGLGLMGFAARRRKQPKA